MLDGSDDHARRLATRIEIPGTTNVRDLGGYPTQDGGTVSRGRLFRAEELGAAGTGCQSFWDDAQQSAYSALALRTVIDLRADFEVERAPSQWPRASGATLVHIPVTEGVEGSPTDFLTMMSRGELTEFSAADLGRWYAEILDRRATQYGRIVSVLAQPGALPALIHCQGGKDRTGLAIALILEVLGVARAEVVADYALTAVFRPGRAEAVGPMLATYGVALDRVRVLFESPQEAMASALDRVDSEWGGAERFLVERAQVTAEEIARLRSAMVGS